jgi:hypothetical protein
VYLSRNAREDDLMEMHNAAFPNANDGAPTGGHPSMRFWTMILADESSTTTVMGGIFAARADLITASLIWLAISNDK